MRLGIDLPENKHAILNALLDRLETEFAEDIAIVACYGSYVTGMPTQVSDLDFYFIPSTPRGYQASYQFIIDGIGYDLWPVSWERAERIADCDELLVSIVADAHPVYYRTLDDMDRFSLLKDRVSELMKPQNRPKLLPKAGAMLNLAKLLFFDACASDGDLQHVLICASGILEYVLAALAFTNSSYVRKGAVRLEDEVAQYDVVPDGFIEHFRAVIEGEDPRVVLEHLRVLITSVDAVITDLRGGETHTVSSENASGFYEELKSTYDKLYDACDNRAQARAFFAANAVVREVMHLLGAEYIDHCFPDLHTPLSERDYELLKKRATEHEAILFSLLQDHGVAIKEFPGVTEFCSSLTHHER
jgi:hypothetical protein